MGDGVVGGGCYVKGVGGWCCGRRLLWEEVVGGMVWEEGVVGDDDEGGGCWGDDVGGGCWGDGVVGGGDGVIDNTSEPTNIFRSDFWGLFSPLPSLSNLLFLLSQLSVHVHAYLSLLSLSSLWCRLHLWSWQPILPSQSRGDLSLPAGGPQTMIFNVQAPQMTLQTVVTGLQPVTTYLILYSSIYCWWSRGGAAISTLEFGKHEIDGHPYIDITLSSLPHLKTTTPICN